MLKRIITGIVSILIFIPVCIASHFEGWDIVFPIAISILSAIGVFEMSKCLGYHKNLVLTNDSYFTTFTDLSKKDDLAQIGLDKEIIW